MSRIWKMKEGIDKKKLAKIQVRQIFRIRDIRRNASTKFIGICMETPCWYHLDGHQHGKRETNRNISYRVLLKKREFIPRGTH